MRVTVTMLGQMAYGGLAQHSVILVKYLRELGCEVLPLVGLAPPHNDEVPLDELGYSFDAFNVADYVLRDKPAPVRWLVGWYARRQVTNGHPRKVRNMSMPAIEVDHKRIVENMFFNPDDGDLKKIEKKREEFRPDVDYVCELSLAGYFGMFKDLGVPLVVAAQGYEVCQRYGIDVISAIKQNTHRIDTVVSGSEANVRENLAKDLPFLLPYTRVVHYGIVDDENYAMSDDEARRRSAQFVRPSDAFNIVTLSRIDVEKGTDLALHALRILLNEGINARLRLVGDAVNGEHFRTTIRDKISLMDLTEYVDYVGFVESKADKVALLKTSDAFLAPFIRSEPFGLVYCEAMAAGLPVIAPNNGAGPEIIGWNGYKAGMAYRSQDTGQMADCLRFLVEHPAEAETMGLAGVRAVAEHFNARRMASDIYNLFQEAIDRRKQGTRSYHAPAREPELV
ncbi:MAG: glycosyltransferase family 4 protein [Chloroflexota bacterium]